MTVKPSDALVVVDVQNDFCPGGSLAVDEGDQVVPVVNRLLPLFQHRIFTRDWHPEDHCSFSDDPDFTDMSWPPHCVRNTPGAEFHPDLNVPSDALVISKATQQERERYSGFGGTQLERELRNRDVTRLFICGLATDICVKSTALDARELNFDAVVVEDACRGVDSPPGNVTEAVKEMKQAGVQFVTSGDLT